MNMYACTIEGVEKLSMKVMLLKAPPIFNFQLLSMYVFFKEPLPWVQIS